MRARLDPAVPYVVTGPPDWDEEVKRQQDLLSEQLVGWRAKCPDLRLGLVPCACRGVPVPVTP